MADVSRLLNQATGKAQLVEKRLKDLEPPIDESPAESATRMQLKQSWLQSSITQEMFSSIGSAAKHCEQTATDIAINSFNEEARIKITHLLIKAKTLRDVIAQYTK